MCAQRRPRAADSVPHVLRDRNGQGACTLAADVPILDHHSMILPVQTRVREHLPRSWHSSMASTPRPCRRLPSSPRPTASSATWARRSPSSWRAGCARRRAPSPRKSPPPRRRCAGVRQVVAAPNGYLNFFLDRSAFLRERLGRAPAAAPAPATARPSSSTRPSTRTRRPTSATCATPRSATRSCARCASAAPASRCRTTSTTPACRSPTSWSASASSNRKSLDEIRADRRHDALRLLLLGPLRAGHRVVRRRQGAAGHPRRDAARHRARRQRQRRGGRLHRRSHRPLPPADDGAPERGLRPPDLGGRHPAPQVLGAGVRRAQGRRAPSTCARTAAWPAAGSCRSRRTSTPRPSAERARRDARRADGRGADGQAPKPSAETEREKVIVRSNGVVTYVGKDIAYQFWKLGLLGPRLPVPRVRRAARRSAVGDLQHRRRGRPSAVRRRRRTSTTSSTSGSRTCRSC